MPRGGARPGSGHPKGKKNKTTLLRLKSEREMQQRIMGRMARLLNAQFSLAEGVQVLYRVDKDEKGRAMAAVVVTNPGEIKDFIDHQNGLIDLDTDSFYYIAAQKPDARALENLLDRAYGKATQKTSFVDDEGHTVDAKVTFEFKNGENKPSK